MIDHVRIVGNVRERTLLSPVGIALTARFGRFGLFELLVLI
jgi:hypothetical protein